jgi:hypothetical protein
MKPVTLSPSTISLFIECPHCFWLKFNRGIKRPETGFPTLPSGMDGILKRHFDRHRQDRSLPEELEGKFVGRLFDDLGKLEIWRSNYKGLRYKDERTGANLMGALDDLFVTNDGKYAPLDFKTRGYPRKEEIHASYQRQMDIYSFLLEKNSLPPADFAILIFYHPTGVDERHNVIFDPDPVKVAVDRKRGEKLFLDAVACLAGGEPQPSKNCGFCEWAGKVNHKEEKQANKTEKKNNLFDFV